MGISNMRIMLTPAMSKRLIALGICEQDCINEKLQKGIIAICGGTTNAYVAEAILEKIGCDIGELKTQMFRGITVPYGKKVKKSEIADVVIIDGKWERELSFADVVDRISEGDVVIKGGNAVYPENGEVGVLMGNPVGGTLMLVSRAAYGKRAKILAPVGLEKRVYQPIADLMEVVNEPGMEGTRLGLLPAKAYTEIDAISDLTCADAVLIAGGGVMGAEGALHFQVLGEEEDIARMKTIYEELKKIGNYTQD